MRAALAALALAFALAHLPYLVSSLEDIDSVNFALGIRDFDVARHRPHPPGYPVYIALGKLGVAMARPVTGTASPSEVEARTLSVLSLVGALAALVFLYRALCCWSRATPSDPLSAAPWQRLSVQALAATGLAMACPLVWYLAVRPMSDLPGLAAALAAQAALGLAWWRQQPDASGDRRLAPERLAGSGRMIVLGALLAGIAIGFRSQNAILTAPLLLGVLVDRIGRGVAGAMIGSSMALATGIAVWAIPLVAVSGGLGPYLDALGSQAGEDFAGVEMLYLHPSPRLAATALMRTFIHPWDSVLLGSVVVSLSVIGACSLLIRDRRSLAGLTLVTAPYLAFHLLFQDTTFVRYAVPLVPPMAYLAVSGLAVLVRSACVPATAVLAVWSVALALPVVAAYASEASPTVRALAAMRADTGPRPGALALHQTFQRPLEAEGAPLEPQLPSPPRLEWLELVRYWQLGQTAPLWFLADPRRTDLALIDPHSRADRVDFGWSFTSLSDMGGMRPAAVAWYRMSAPGWFAEEGWALTPETAGIARLMGRGPSPGPITAWVRRRRGAARAIVGGRHLGGPTDPNAVFVMEIDGAALARWETSPGFFVRDIELPAGALSGEGPLARLTLRAEGVAGTPVAAAVEQFDLQSKGDMMWAYDEGWHEAEYGLDVGLWRWASDRSTLRIVDAATAVAVTMRVERPRRYFDEDPRVRMVAGTRVIGETTFRDAELWSVVVPLDALQAAGGRITLETNQTFVPAERGGPPDRRRLGLRVFGISVTAQP